MTLCWVSAVIVRYSVRRLSIAGPGWDVRSKTMFQARPSGSCEAMVDKVRCWVAGVSSGVFVSAEGCLEGARVKNE